MGTLSGLLRISERLSHPLGGSTSLLTGPAAAKMVEMIIEPVISLFLRRAPTVRQEEHRVGLLLLRPITAS
jgi:hypothetical protein